jgi:hypothetical protein
MIVARAHPLQIVHAQSVQQDGHFAPCARERGAQCRSVHRERRPVRAQAHRDSQGIRGRVQIVTEHAVECGDDGFPFQGRLTIRDQRREQAKERVDTATDQTGDAANRLVNQSGDTACSTRRRFPEDCRRLSYRVMHGLDEIGQADDGVVGQALQAAKIRHRDMSATDHGVTVFGWRRGSCDSIRH